MRLVNLNKFSLLQPSKTNAAILMPKEWSVLRNRNVGPPVLIQTLDPAS